MVLSGKKLIKNIQRISLGPKKCVAKPKMSYKQSKHPKYSVYYNIGQRKGEHPLI